MGKYTSYTNLYEITELQQKIMRYVDYWVHVEKKPIPQAEIVKQMKDRKEKNFTVVKALDSLMRLGYLRRAITTGSGETGVGANKTKYVQLRRL